MQGKICISATYREFQNGVLHWSRIRFAHKLEFGEKTHEVSMTALRLVSRMKKVSMADVRVSPS